MRRPVPHWRQEPRNEQRSDDRTVRKERFEKPYTERPEKRRFDQPAEPVIDSSIPAGTFDESGIEAKQSADVYFGDIIVDPPVKEHSS